MQRGILDGLLAFVAVGQERSFTKAAAKLGVDLLEPGAHGVKQAFACFRRRDAARGAGQKANAQPGFECANRVAERRLRNAELRCGFRETALSSHGGKGREVIQNPALHL
jgi:hypothetical protein